MPSERLRLVRGEKPDTPREPPPPPPPPPTREELRRSLAKIPPARLVDLLLTVSDHEYEFLQRLRRLVTMTEGGESALDVIRSEMRTALTVTYVAWDGVGAFIHGLEVVLGEIGALGTRDPRVAMTGGLDFLEALPRVFDCVQGEYELQDFANELARSVLAHAAAARVPIEETAVRLFAVMAADAHGFYAGLADAVLAAWDGRANASLAEIAEGCASSARIHAVEMRDFAAVVRVGRVSRT